MNPAKLSTSGIELPFENEVGGLVERKNSKTTSPGLAVTQVNDSILEKEDNQSKVDSDVEDALNCLKSPWEVKCITPRFFPKKEENVVSKGIYYRKSSCTRDHDYELAFGTSRQMPIVHVKGCGHEVLASINALQTKQAPKMTTVGPKQAPQIEDDGQPMIRNMFIGRDDNIVKYSAPHLEKDAQPYVELQGLLNFILPPIETIKDGEKWILEVSKEPTRRSEVIKLAETIELELLESQCKNDGFDPIRRKLFDQLFDELVRQETIVSGETGFFLLRIKNEMLMTIGAWENLVMNANNYSSLQALQGSKIITPLLGRIQFEEESIVDYEKIIVDDMCRKALVNYDENETDKRHAESREIEIAEIQAANKCLKEIIKLLIMK